MVQWLYYPRSREAPQLARQVVRVLEAASPEISSARHNLSSNQVLSRLAPGLDELGWSPYNQFLKDLFQACMMVGVTEFVVALRLDYRGSNDFEKVCRFFETLYVSGRLRLPLAGVLVVGY